MPHSVQSLMVSWCLDQWRTAGAPRNRCTIWVFLMISPESFLRWGARRSCLLHEFIDGFADIGPVQDEKSVPVFPRRPEFDAGRDSAQPFDALLIRYRVAALAPVVDAGGLHLIAPRMDETPAPLPPAAAPVRSRAIAAES